MDDRIISGLALLVTGLVIGFFAGRAYQTPRLAVFAWFSIASFSLAQTPTLELHAAALDASKLPPDVAIHSRYLTLYDLAPEHRENGGKVTSGVLNYLSRQRAIAQAVKISPTLWRLDTRWYASEEKDNHEWELAWGSIASLDSTWHIRTEVLLNGKRQITTVPNGAYSLEDAATLQRCTGSQGALLRATDFIARAMVTPEYYRFVGVPATQKEFEKSLGLDSETIDRLRANAGANLIFSDVTKKFRRIIWSQSPLGGFYATLDVNSTDAEKDPIRRLLSVGDLAMKYDATEIVAQQPNGLWRFALYDSAGKVQQTVPDVVAADSKSVEDGAPNAQVVPGFSCIRCHSESGLRPFADAQTRLFASGRIDLKSYDPAVIQRIKDFYQDARLQRQMAFDRTTYDAAIGQCTDGMTAERFSAALGSLIKNYSYGPVTPEIAAREVCLPEGCTLMMFAGSSDPILLELLEGRNVQRGQWQASFATASLITETWRRNNP